MAKRFQQALRQKQTEHVQVDGADDWVANEDMRRWIASTEDWEDVRTPTKLIIPDNQRELYFGRKWYTRVPPSVRRTVSQHSYRQQCAKVPRYRQHTIASSMKQRMVEQA